MQTQTDNKKIPATIFSGFLGSGKTTIISNLIDELQASGQQVVYIKNEIGNTDVDGKLLNKKVETEELLNGCICCTLVGPFANSVKQLISSFQPDRIIIEASGAADPAALALMVSSHPDLLRDGVIGIIDVLNFEGYKDISVTAKNQTKFTDLIVFNKVELATLEQKKAVVGYVRELNTHSPIVEAPNGVIAQEIIFGLNSKELSALLTETNNTEKNHIHEDSIQTFNILPKGQFQKEQLEKFLNSTPKNIFRTKGFVTLNDNQQYLFNTVGDRTTFTLVNSEEKQENILVFIGFMAHSFENEAQTKLKELAH